MKFETTGGALVDNFWRNWPNSNEWQVTPETARLLKHWRQHKFSGVRPFFCQIEAVETAIWLTEVAPQSKAGKRVLDHLTAANPHRIALSMRGKNLTPILKKLELLLAGQWTCDIITDVR